MHERDELVELLSRFAFQSFPFSWLVLGLCFGLLCVWLLLLRVYRVKRRFSLLLIVIAVGAALSIALLTLAIIAAKQTAQPREVRYVGSDGSAYIATGLADSTGGAACRILYWDIQGAVSGTYQKQSIAFGSPSTLTTCDLTQNTFTVTIQFETGPAIPFTVSSP